MSSATKTFERHSTIPPGLEAVQGCHSNPKAFAQLTPPPLVDHGFAHQRALRAFENVNNCPASQ